MSQEGQLLQAASKGNTNVVRALLKNGANVRARNKEGKTALLFALEGLRGWMKVLDYLDPLKDRLETVMVLLEFGVDVNAQDKKGMNALHHIVEASCPLKPLKPVIKAILDKGGDIYARGKPGLCFAKDTRGLKLPCEGHSPLCWAVRTRDPNLRYEMLQIFLERAEYGRVEEADEEGKTIMHYLTNDGGAIPMKALLDKGADIHAVDQNGTTAFHNALNVGTFASIYPMLEKGYDVNVPNRRGFTALHFVTNRVRCNLDLVKRFIQHGAEVNATCVEGLTPLDLAIQAYYAEENETKFRRENIESVIRELKKNGAVTNTFDTWGEATIYRLVRTPNGHKSQPLRVLQMTGADINIRNKINGLTALQFAVFKECMVCVKDLIAAGCDVNRAGARGQTALHIAARRGDTKMVNALIQAGAAIDIEDDEGKTPGQVAGKWGHRKFKTSLNMTSGKGTQTGKRKSPKANSPVKKGRIGVDLEDKNVIIR